MQVTISGVAQFIVDVRFEKTVEVSSGEVIEVMELDEEESQENWKDCIEEYISDYGIYEIAYNEIEGGMALELTDDTDGYSLSLDGFTLDRLEEFNVEQ